MSYKRVRGAGVLPGGRRLDDAVPPSRPLRRPGPGPVLGPGSREPSRHLRIQAGARRVRSAACECRDANAEPQPADGADPAPRRRRGAPSRRSRSGVSAPMSLRRLLPTVVPLISGLIAPAHAQDAAIVEAIAPLLQAEDSRQWASAALETGTLSPEPLVRRTAAISIGRIGDLRGTALLVPMLQDRDSTVHPDRRLRARPPPRSRRRGAAHRPPDCDAATDARNGEGSRYRPRQDRRARPRRTWSPGC